MRRTSLAVLATVALAVPVGATEWFRVPTSELAGLPADASTVRLDYGSFLWIGAEDGAPLRSAGFEATDFTLDLGGVRFDPLDADPALPPAWTRGLTARTTGPADALSLVQFVGPTRGEWLSGLRSEGHEVVAYVHPFTYIVHGDVASGLTAAPHVRWTGPFQPAYKVQPAWRDLGPAPIRASGLLLRSVAREQPLLDRLRDLGATDLRSAPIDETFLQVKFEIGGDRLLEAAQLDGVYVLKPQPRDGGLRGEMSNQINVNNHDGANLAFPGYSAWLGTVGLDGAGVVMANVDGGIDGGHADLAGRMVSCVGDTCGGSASSQHGTHTAGIMAADGASGTTDSNGFLRGLGVAPGASLVEQVYSPTFTQEGGMLKLIRESSENGAVLSGNSWGPAGSPQGYDGDTRQVDIGVRDAQEGVAGLQPFTYVLSFMNGNGGTSTQGSPDEAKNLFNIGSTKMQTGSGQQILDVFDLSSNSAHGPALDGRTIPHMVAPGCNVDSTTPSNGYGLLCGTSMASPHVSGAVGLFFEFYRDFTAARGGAADPSPALVKAAFLPVAHDLAGFDDADGGTLGHPFDSKQGWGRMDLEAVVDPQVLVQYFDDPVLLTGTGQQWSQTVGVPEADEPVRLMLVWTDAPGHGLGGSTPAWNNDLDLVVEAGGSTYLGNAFGAGGFSDPTASTPDDKNNTEGVFLPAGSASSLKIRVDAANLGSDGVPGNGEETDQDFALVCYNCALTEDFTLAADPRDVEVCAPEDVEIGIDVGAILDFDETVTLSVSDLPGGASAAFTEETVDPPGTSSLTIGNTGAITPGTSSPILEGTSASKYHALELGLVVVDAAPPAPGLLEPPDGAVGVETLPMLSWSAAAQAASYTVEVATDPAFGPGDLVASATLDKLEWTLEEELETNTEYFWRVVPTNACDTGAASTTRSFRTEAAPGDCGVGTLAIHPWSEGFESGAAGWTSSGTGDTWSASQARVRTGSWSWWADDPDSTSDQRLVSPRVDLPSAGSPVLRFWSYQSLERRSASACWDGGVLEISTDDGQTWNQITTGLVTDAYDGPVSALGDAPGWCGDPQDWTRSVIELDPWAGQTVRFRFRLGSDSIIGREGWYLDDVDVQACLETTIFSDGFESGDLSAW